CLPQQEHGAPTLALLMSCFFWKSGYKYAEFGYRLQSLDVGVVLAQSVLVTGWEGWQPTVHYRFLDQVANQLLGLDAAYESVYALITLCPRAASRQEAASSSPLLPLERLYLQAEPGTEQGMSLARWPLLEQLHRASLLTAPAALTETRHLPPIAVPSGQASLPMPLPEPLALRQALYQRHSAMLYFRRGELTQQQVSTLLLESMRGYTNDLDGQPVMVQHTLLYCVINAVAGISPGIYIYHPEKRALELVQTGDMRAALQGTLTWFSHNMWNVSLCLFPVADYEQGFVVYGDRWYRIQNMEAGLLIQRLYLAAAALALGCQANLGYQTQRAHELLRLPARYRCLAQLMIAPEARAGQYYEQVLW
ncbi:MAG TPA: nitroreductase family protein, partial [Ktedonobacteraceae bacterium]|nr:nitroreductase family protein [Ktedonobacteraceae bacterium]